MTELATANEKLAAKDSELQERMKELRELSECFHRKENESSEMTARLTEISKIKSQLDEANAHVDALGKKCCSIDRVQICYQDRVSINTCTFLTGQFPLH